MPKASPIQTAFNAGELSPQLYGRTDVSKYASGCKQLLNMLPLIHGPATRRPGTRFVATAKQAEDPIRLIPFEFSVEQAYVLEAGQNYLRFFRDEGRIEIEATDAAIANGTFDSGIASWSDESTGTGAISHDATGEYMVLTGTDASNVAAAEQEVAIGGGYQDRLHVLRFRTIDHDGRRARLKLRIGTTSGDEDVVKERTFSPGWHAVAFTPDAASVFVRFLNDTEDDSGAASGVGLDDVAFDSGAPLELGTPYQSGELAALQWAQSADVLYLTHQAHPIMKLLRYGHETWSLVSVELARGPFDSENVDEDKTVFVDKVAPGELATVTASHPTFEADDVGNTFRLGEPLGTLAYQPWRPLRNGYGGSSMVSFDGLVYGFAGGSFYNDGWATGEEPPIHEQGIRGDGNIFWEYLHDGAGELVITEYVSETEVKGIVRSRIPINASSLAGSGETKTSVWAFGLYAPKTGYPSTVTFYEERLYFAGCPIAPQRFDGSRSGDFENFRAGPLDDHAVAFALAADQVNVIRWMNAGRSLAIGTVGGEWDAQGGQSGGPITPSSIQVKRQSTHGSTAIRPKRVGDAVIFVQRSGRRLRELAFHLDNDGLVANDLTVLAEHITAGGLQALDFQQEPNSVLWAVRGDGVLLGITYERSQKVVGWHRHVLGGSLDGGAAKVDSLAVIPAPSDDHDQVWLSVRRTVGGQTVRHVEFLAPHPSRDAAPEDIYLMDCGLSYDGSPATVLSGLDHLEGETVAVVADGAVLEPKTVSGGQITLDDAAEKVHAGYSFTSRLQTLRIEAGAADGTAQGKTKRLHRVTLRVERSRGLLAGPDETRLDPVPDTTYRDPTVPMGEVMPLFDGDATLSWPAGYEREGFVTVEVRDPLPFTLVAVMPQLLTQDR